MERSAFGGALIVRYKRVRVVADDLPKRWTLRGERWSGR